MKRTRVNVVTISLALAAHAVTGAASAEDRYVSLSGDDTLRYYASGHGWMEVENSCAQPSKPCRTIEHAISRAENKDVIKLDQTIFVENLSYIYTGDGKRTLVIEGGWNADFSERAKDQVSHTALKRMLKGSPPR